MAAGGEHSGLLTSGGHAMACGYNADEQCGLPAAPSGEEFVAVAAGAWHSVLLTSGGHATTCGRNDD